MYGLIKEIVGHDNYSKEITALINNDKKEYQSPQGEQI